MYFNLNDFYILTNALLNIMKASVQCILKPYLFSQGSAKSDVESDDRLLNDIALVPPSQDPGDELNDIVRDHPVGPGTRGGEPKDPAVREKRDKIREVSGIFYSAVIGMPSNLVCSKSKESAK